MKLPFFIVDVFAERKFCGNQLAVCVNAGQLSSGQMQEIAREMNYSETAFLLSGKKRDNGYDVRIFTPEQEVPFAGHPTLGTAFVIQKEIVGKPVKKVKLNLPAGQIPVAFKYSSGEADRLWMKQRNPEFGPVMDRGETAAVLNLPESAVDDRFPVQEVSTGLPFIIVPLKTLQALKEARIDHEAHDAFVSGTSAKAIFLFCPETYEDGQDLSARMFAPHFGIEEDPATGSANGCLAGYLIRHRYLGTDTISITVGQGYVINRPSVLYLRAEPQGEKIDVTVGGRVVMVARGTVV